MNNVLSYKTWVLLKRWCWRGALYTWRTHLKGYMVERWSCHASSILASCTLLALSSQMCNNSLWLAA